MTTISEKQFEDSCEASLRRFSQRIRASGLSIYKIGKMARLSWRTVQKAVDCVPIRFENAERIKLVIDKIGGNDGVRQADET